MAYETILGTFLVTFFYSIEKFIKKILNQLITRNVFDQDYSRYLI